MTSSIANTSNQSLHLQHNKPFSSTDSKLSLISRSKTFNPSQVSVQLAESLRDPSHSSESNEAKLADIKKAGSLPLGDKDRARKQLEAFQRLMKKLGTLQNPTTGLKGKQFGSLAGQPIFETNIKPILKLELERLSALQKSSHIEAMPFMEGMRQQTIAALRASLMKVKSAEQSDEDSKDGLAPAYNPLGVSSHHSELVFDALQKCSDFHTALNADVTQNTLTINDTHGLDHFTDLTMSDIHKENQVIVQNIVKDPLKAYENMSARLSKDIQAPFPEFKYTVLETMKGLSTDIIKENTALYSYLAPLHNRALKELKGVLDRGCPYLDTVSALKTAVDFLDIHERGRIGGRTTPLYHTLRWLYYMPHMKAQAPKYILFPTSFNIGATQILKVRGVPLGFVGVSDKPVYADGHWNTPAEFFVHDLNHSRRMWEQFVDISKEEVPNQPTLDTAINSSNDVTSVLRKLIYANPKKPIPLDTIKPVIKMLLFEILHEDALPAFKNIILESLLRAPYQQSRFLYERQEKDLSVTYGSDPSATVAAFTYRKLTGEFYDRPEDRMGLICPEQARSKQGVVDAAFAIIAALSETQPSSDTFIEFDGKKYSEADVRAILQQNVDDDSGLPNDIRSKILELGGTLNEAAEKSSNIQKTMESRQAGVTNLPKEI